MPLTITEMQKLIDRLNEAKGDDVEILPSYIQRLERAAELLGKYRALPKFDWNSCATVDDIERGEILTQQKLELVMEIEKHLNVCGMTVPSGKRGGAKAQKLAVERKRQPRRSKAQVEYDEKFKEITRQKRRELGFPDRGKIRAEDKLKLDKAIEAELKKRKLESPRD